MKFKRLYAALIGIGLLSLGSTFGSKKMIQIKGSDTLVNLVQILAESYMERHPETPIAVMGGGSGTGIAALINNTCDIANLSRPMKESELKLAGEKGIAPRLFVIAVDGLSVIVNKDNPVNELTMDIIGAVYRGEIKNWSEVGGPNKPISLYGRQSNSGTYEFFLEHVMGNQDYSPHMKQMNGNAQIVEGVIQDKFGIGYVGVGYVLDGSGKVTNGLKILNVAKDTGSKAFSPLDKAAVGSGDYPVARGLFQTTSGAPNGDIKTFIEFILSPEGQKIVEKEGFFPVGPSQQEENRKNLK